MLRAADRVAEAYRSECPDTIAAVVEAAVTIPAPDGAPHPWQALVGALAVQVDVDVPWRERFAWTLEIAAVADPIPDPGPSSASYRSASACFDGDTWGAAPSSNTPEGGMRCGRCGLAPRRRPDGGWACWCHSSNTRRAAA